MRFDEASVRGPHHLLKLPELAQKTGILVIDLLRVLAKFRMLVLLYVPDAVRKSSLFCASNFLLVETPVRQLDLVREERAAGHDVDKLELRLNRANLFLCQSSVGQRLDNLNAEKIVGITLEALITIGRDLVLPVCLTHWRTDIMGVQSPICDDVVKTKNASVFDVDGINVVPSFDAFDFFPIHAMGLRLIFK